MATNLAGTLKLEMSVPTADTCRSMETLY
jgi:hypothetical protein